MGCPAPRDVFEEIDIFGCRLPGWWCSPLPCNEDVNGRFDDQREDRQQTTDDYNGLHDCKGSDEYTETEKHGEEEEEEETAGERSPEPGTGRWSNRQQPKNRVCNRVKPKQQRVEQLDRKCQV